LKNSGKLPVIVATASCESGRVRPSSVRSCSEPGLDPVEQIVPIVFDIRILLDYL
jgi:hypothetical protein